MSPKLEIFESLERVLQDSSLEELRQFVPLLDAVRTRAFLRLVELLAERTEEPPAATQLVTATELARILGVPQSWVRQAARQGRVPSVRFGRYVRFDPVEVRKTLDAQRGTVLRDVAWTRTRCVGSDGVSGSRKRSSPAKSASRVIPLPVGKPDSSE